MDITLLTSKTCHCIEIEQELMMLGFDYTRCDIEDHPELARRFNVRHCPTLIVDEHRVIAIDETNASELKQLLDSHSDPA